MDSTQHAHSAGLSDFITNGHFWQINFPTHVYSMPDGTMVLDAAVASACPQIPRLQQRPTSVFPRQVAPE